MKSTTKKPKKGFLDGYKTYDPSKEGFGSPAQWREAFYERLGFEKAQEVLGDENPYFVLGFASENVTWPEIQQAYRDLAKKWHPDMNKGNEEEAKKQFQRIQAAFEILEARYG